MASAAAKEESIKPRLVETNIPDLAVASVAAEEEGVRPRLVEATRKKAALGSQLTQLTRGKENSKLDSDTVLFSWQDKG